MSGNKKKMSRGHHWKKLTREVNRRQVTDHLGQKHTLFDTIRIGRECQKCGKQVFYPTKSIGE